MSEIDLSQPHGWTSKFTVDLTKGGKTSLKSLKSWGRSEHQDDDAEAGSSNPQKWMKFSLPPIQSNEWIPAKKCSSADTTESTIETKDVENDSAATSKHSPKWIKTKHDMKGIGQCRRKKDAATVSTAGMPKHWFQVPASRPSLEGSNIWESFTKRTTPGNQEPADSENDSSDSKTENSESPNMMSWFKLPRKSEGTTVNIWEGLKRKPTQESNEVTASSNTPEDALQKWLKENIQQYKANPRLLLPRRRSSKHVGEYEGVYLVMRPINFEKSSSNIIKRIGEWTDMVQLHQYLLFQHWGVQIGEQFYHLHIVDDERVDWFGKKHKVQKLAVSLSPFEQVTLKIPIWRTKKSHEDRVKDAVSLIRAMGGYKNDEEVGVYGDSDETGEKEVLLPQSELAKYRRKKKCKRFFPMPFSGEYHITLNNCIHFARRYLFYFIFDVVPLTITATEYAKNMEWVLRNWATGLANLDYAKLLEMFMGLMNPMRMLTLTSGNQLMARLAMVYVGKMEPDQLTRGEDTVTLTSTRLDIGGNAEDHSSSVEEGDDIHADDLEGDSDDDSDW